MTYEQDDDFTAEQFQEQQYSDRNAELEILEHLQFPFNIVACLRQLKRRVEDAAEES